MSRLNSEHGAHAAATSANKPSRRFLLPALCSVAIASAVITGGCTSSAGPAVASLGSTTTTLAGSAVGEGGDPNLQQAYQAQLAYAQCMRTHGVLDYPDPTTTSGGGWNLELNWRPSSTLDPSSPIFRRAHGTCSALHPGGGL